MLITVIFVLIVSAIIAIVWVKGISNMHEKHPDYKGLDLFDEEDIYDEDVPAKKKGSARKPK